MFNVEYVNMNTHTTHYYLKEAVTGDIALACLATFKRKYVNDHSPFVHASIVRVS